MGTVPSVPGFPRFPGQAWRLSPHQLWSCMQTAGSSPAFGALGMTKLFLWRPGVRVENQERQVRCWASREGNTKVKSPLLAQGAREKCGIHELYGLGRGGQLYWRAGFSAGLATDRLV